MCSKDCPAARLTAQVDVTGLSVTGLETLRGEGDGVPLTALVALLESIDPSSLPDDYDVVELAAAWHAVAAAVAGRQIAVVAELAARPEVYGPDDDPSVIAAREVRAPAGTTTRTGLQHEVAARLVENPGRSGLLCRLSLELPVRFPVMWAELQAGRASETKARVLVEACRAMDDDDARAVDAVVAERATRLTPSAFRQSVRRVVLRQDPATATERRQRAEAGRCVRINPGEDGMAELWALLPATAATRLGQALESFARSARANGDERTLDQLRADALTEQISATVEVQVVVPASMLLGQSDTPGELTGFGPIDAGLARTLATDATWRRVLTDPDDGSLSSVGSTTYRPGVVLARHVRLRDQQCRFPSCPRPVEWCDLDHTIPFGQPGGATLEDNLGGLCRRHHQFKHAHLPDANAPPRLRQPSPGCFEWDLPSGHTYRVGPPPLLDPDDPLAVLVDSSTPLSVAEHGLEHCLRGYRWAQSAAA